MRRPFLIALAWLGLGAAAAAAVNAPANNFLPKSKPKKHDLNALRAEVDETLAVLDLLARESRLLSKTAKAALVEALKTEYQLEDRRAQAAEAMEEAEAVLGLQEEVKAQEKSLAGDPPPPPGAKDAPGGSPSPLTGGGQALSPAQREEALEKLKDLKEDLADEIQSLRSDLSSLHKGMNEEEARNFRNWAMVSGGLLKRKREKAAALPPPPPGAEDAPGGSPSPLSGGGRVSPEPAQSR